jgi:hypothetical protein
VLQQTLHLVANPPVTTAGSVLFVVKCVADKIPVFDLLWNALQDFVRVPVANDDLRCGLTGRVSCCTGSATAPLAPKSRSVDLAYFLEAKGMRSYNASVFRDRCGPLPRN